MDKIFDAKCSFHVHYEKGLIDLFQEFFASGDKILILGGD